jgi:hypothetical protein
MTIPGKEKRRCPDQGTPFHPVILSGFQSVGPTCIRSAGPINQPLLWKKADPADLEIEISTMTTVIFLGGAVPGVNGDTFPCAITTAEALASAILSEPGCHQHWLGHGCTFEPEQPCSPERIGPWAVDGGGRRRKCSEAPRDRTSPVPGWVGCRDVGGQQ